MIDFTALINQHGDGTLMAELNDTLVQLIKDCKETGKKGTLTLAVALEPSTTRDGLTQIKVTPGVTSKNPKYDSPVQFHFVVTDDNGVPVALERENPRQIQMFNGLTLEMGKKETE